jgi:hypothetical protein
VGEMCAYCGCAMCNWRLYWEYGRGQSETGSLQWENHKNITYLASDFGVAVADWAAGRDA